MKIVISNIPGVFPSNYPEQLYLDARSVREDVDFFVAETEGKIQVVNDTSYRKRTIQSIFYDKYTIEFIATESVNIGFLSIAGTISITQDNGEQHLAEIIDFSEPTKLQQSEFRQYTLVYRDLNSKETVNHLTYDSTINPDYALKFLYVSSNYLNPTLSVYSPVYPILSISEYEGESNKDNQIETRSVENAFHTIFMQFYLDEDTKNGLLKSINQDNFNRQASGTFDSGFVAQFNSINYTAVEVPQITVEDSELEGIFAVNIIMRYYQILNYPYE